MGNTTQILGTGRIAFEACAEFAGRDSRFVSGPAAELDRVG